MKKDDLIAKAINLGLGEDIDLVALSKSELEELINSEIVSQEEEKKELKREIPKHDYYRN